MNDLQITLMIVGGGGIAAMIGYNWWQDYRLRRQASERFGESEEDPLFSHDNRTEPGLHASSTENAPADLGEPVLQDEADKRVFSDFVLHFESPVGLGTLKPLIDGLQQSYQRKVVFSVAGKGFDEAPEADLLWMKPESMPEGIHHLKVSAQLASRSGAITAIEFSNILSRIKRFGEERNAELEFPEMKEVVSRAETLDQAAAALDTLLGLHCLLSEEIQESMVIDMLTEAGWQSKGHHWHFAGEQGSLVSMVLHKAPGKKLLSFSIDVPCSPDPVQALKEVVGLCHGLNSQFGAPLMDDSGRTLTTEAIEDIYNHLLERVKNLTDSGFEPGSRAAKTLFV